VGGIRAGKEAIGGSKPVERSERCRLLRSVNGTKEMRGKGVCNVVRESGVKGSEGKGVCKAVRETWCARQ
jgi:hypothetical protein